MHSGLHLKRAVHSILIDKQRTTLEQQRCGRGATCLEQMCSINGWSIGQTEVMGVLLHDALDLGQALQLPTAVRARPRY